MGASAELIDMAANALVAAIWAASLCAGDHFLAYEARQRVVTGFIAWLLLSRWVKSPALQSSISVSLSFAGPFIYCPASLTGLGEINYVSLLLSPTVQWWACEGTDDVNMGGVIKAFVSILSYTGTVLFFRYAMVCFFLAMRFVASRMFVFIIVTGSFLYMFWRLCSVGLKSAVQTRLWSVTQPLLRYLLRFSLWSLETAVGSFKSLLNFLNACEGIVMDKFQQQLQDMSSPSYVYKSLDSPRKIRLLKLHRRKFFTKLQCEILETELEEAPPFEALSYTWRNEMQTDGIPVGSSGEQLIVTPAINEFLQYRRTFFGEKIFWIDAACINQNDVEERSHQVTLMKDVYQRASRVVVWLGPRRGAEDSYLARETLSYLISSQHLLSTSPETLFIQLRTKKAPGWVALARMFEHPWFSRVWVAQEVAAAKEVHVMYGNICINWNGLAACIEILSHPFLCGPAQMDDEFDIPGASARVMKRIENLANAGIIAFLRKNVQSGQETSIQTALTVCASFKSTDPRDKIYGLLGIATDGIHESLSPDYSKPVREVYLETTRYFLSQNDSPRGFHLFQSAGIGCPRSPDVDSLPSWVPDWSSARIGRVTEVAPSLLAPNNRGWTAHIQFTHEPHIIKVSGTCVDSIQCVTEAWRYKAGEDMDIKAQPMFYDAAKALAGACFEESGQHVYPDTVALHNALWRTIMTSDTSIENLAPLPPTSMLAILESHFVLLERSKILQPGPELDVILTQLGDTERYLTPFFFRMGASCMSKRFCVTKDGRLGLLPPLAEVGDVVCFLEGLPMPFLLRRKEEGEADIEIEREGCVYEFVGGCYIDTLMGGLGEGWKSEWLVLV